MSSIFSALIFALVCTSQCYSAKILGLFVNPFTSHVIIHTALIDSLVERGHEATVVTVTPLKKENSNFRHIQLNLTCLKPDFITDLVKAPLPIYKTLTKLISENIECSKVILSSAAMRQLMREESFDLVILGHFLNDVLLGVAAHFNCPVILSVTMKPITPTKYLIGNPIEVSYVPNLVGVRQPMSFSTRVKNFIFGALLEPLIVYTMASKENEIYNNNFPPDRYPSFDQMKKNVSIVLANYHFSQGIKSANVPGLIEVGGFHLKDKLDSLPEDLQGVLDSAKNGVIYVSFGSLVKGDMLNNAVIKVMFDVLSKVEQMVLWKLDDSDLPGQSPNIVYKSWFPQSEILGHPNVRLFVTHGGSGSILESKFYGVPMVGIPLCSDQFANIANMVSDGYGVRVDFATITATSFGGAVSEVLTQNRYTENVKEFVRIYWDRPMSAKETAVFWVEYVLRHRGAPHMQSPAVHMNSFQLGSVDVIGFLLLGFFIVFKIIKTFLRFVFKFFTMKAKTKNE